MPDIILLADDVFAALARLRDASIAMVLADPDWHVKADIAAARQRNRMKYTKDVKGFDWERDGDPTTLDEQKVWNARWIAALYRVLKPGGHFICWYDAQRLTHIYEAVAATWPKHVARQILCWRKPFPVPRGGQVGFMSGCELAAWNTKDTVSKTVCTFNAALGQTSNVQTAPQTRGHARVHPAQKPDSLLEVYISYLTNQDDVVLDLFAGSFTASRVALEAGRRAVAVEREPTCWAAAFPGADPGMLPSWHGDVILPPSGGPV